MIEVWGLAIALILASFLFASLLLARLVWRQQKAIDRVNFGLQQLTNGLDEARLEIANAAYLTSAVFRYPVPLGGPSIDTHHARTLLFLLQVLRPKRVLELGSGSSTVFIAHYAKQLGIAIESHVAVDHDERFLNLTRELCKLNGVGDGIEFRYCPLAPTPGHALPWYRIDDATFDCGPFDLVIVDGPPAYEPGTEQSRAPALPVLLSHLSADGVLIFDDTNRDGELKILQSWMKQFPELTFDRRAVGKGHTIISRRPLF